MKFADLPIDKHKDDDLFRSDVASNLAKAIQKHNRAESLVIGIQGGWGDGKTSFINMTLEKLKKGKGKSDYIIIEFNPWYFTGSDQILNQFFNIFATQLITQSDYNKKIFKTAQNIKKLSSLIGSFKGVANIAGSAIGIPALGNALAISTEIIEKGANTVEKTYQPTENLIELKKEIRTALKGFDKKIIVVMDDLDRLNSDEVYEIFRLVKSVADFPKTIYILSYDKNRVSNFLKQKGYDANFIEKIVQQELTLPKPESQVIYNIFEKKLNEIMQELGIAFSDNELTYYDKMKEEGLYQAFQNIRSIKRVLNVIDFEYKILSGEVNLVDFFILCLFKVNAPNMYNHILKYGHIYSFSGRYGEEEIMNRYSLFKENLYESEQWVIPLFETMFPVVNRISSDHSREQWVSEKRIASGEYFERYFTLTIPTDEFSEVDYARIYNSAGDYDKLKAVLKPYKEDKKLGRLLLRLYERTQNFKQENISNLISVLLDEADMIDRNTACQAFKLGQKFFDAVPKDSKKEILFSAIHGTKTGKNYVFNFVRHIGLQHGFIEPLITNRLIPNEDHFIIENDFWKLINLAVERIEPADADELFKTNGAACLHFILKKTNPELFVKIRNEILNKENGLLKVAKAYCYFKDGKSPNYYFSFKELREFLGTEKDKTNKELKNEIEQALLQSNDEALNENIRDALKSDHHPKLIDNV